MIDAQLAALLVDAFLGGLCPEMHLRGIAGVGVQQDELADVVQQARHGQAIAVLVADLRRDAVGRALGRQSMQSEALRRRVPHARALEEFKCAHPARQRLHHLGAEQLHGSDNRVHAHTASGPATWLATRSTAMISATSDSTAVTMSAVAT